MAKTVIALKSKFLNFATIKSIVEFKSTLILVFDLSL
jgi:hypothetical protein